MSRTAAMPADETAMSRPQVMHALCVTAARWEQQFSRMDGNITLELLAPRVLRLYTPGVHTGAVD